MKGPILVLALIGLLGAWGRFTHARSGGRATSPLWMAFTATTMAGLFVVAGAVGYKLSHGVPFANRLAWTDSVIWSEIWVGAGLALMAVYFWRTGLHSLRS